MYMKFKNPSTFLITLKEVKTQTSIPQKLVMSYSNTEDTSDMK